MQIREKMASFFQTKMLPELQTTTDMDQLTSEYTARFYTSAIFGVLQHWLQKTPRQTPEEMSQILRTILVNGLAIK
ncbi:hypothetical protein FD04_GL001685 [Secundilactobacillus odoratitofui DSM 19909 = JCM 15043]|uniref:Transcriptional regulator TetR C-terminal Firmicutes type domain-containing protein n=2 Tax=Secundilactobacillus odoratitofui TaxID=480930 RepID=A0A0R1LXC8_9LACO|nr:TetR-like C-terminal domain-containing protein [Secundilactobacillus odoratitofui]KRK97649.1 hypothetical protein FD04_GL001685 [Secundilactobacillus odoratitofui DSM 19909 = JCM 15043]